MYLKVIMSHQIFFSERACYSFGKIVVILSVAPTVPSYAEQSFSVQQRPKTNLKSTMGQDCLCHLALLCTERAYVNRIDFQPIFRPKNTTDLFWIL